ncbi:Hypothetical_protein [Hexamita inflata]|uniref:Hypothetical_protein n=1 Tax=Hexamita inflata TaxID=28002 RepID=A0AA86QPR7_9EUKA|nr:Hypothetical protein HINF_LOCUS51321 [Hexamita inflata]
MSWCISSFHPQLQTRWFVGLLARVETPQRTVLAPFNHPTVALDVSPEAQAVKSERRRHCIFRVSVTWDSESSCHRRVPSLTAAQTSMCSVFWNRQPPILGPDRYQYINGWIYFWKRRGCLPVARVYFAGLVFIIHTTALSQICISKTEGQAVFGFSIQTDSVFLQPPLNKQSRCLTEFAIGHKLQSFQFRSINLRAAQMEEPWLKKRKNATDPVCFGNAAKVMSEPWDGREFLNLVCYACAAV